MYGEAEVKTECMRGFQLPSVKNNFKPKRAWISRIFYSRTAQVFVISKESVSHQDLVYPLCYVVLVVWEGGG